MKKISTIDMLNKQPIQSVHVSQLYNELLDNNNYDLSSVISLSINYGIIIGKKIERQKHINLNNI